MLAKQSFKVTLLGENTSSCLDFSNVVTFQGDRDSINHWWTLDYPFSISRQLPDNTIDANGIAPDIYLTKNGNWLEGLYGIIENRGQ